MVVSVNGWYWLPPSVQISPKWVGSWAQWIPRSKSSNRDDRWWCKDKIWDWRLFFGRGIAGTREASKLLRLSINLMFCVSAVGRQNVSFCVPKLSKNGCVPKWCLGLCSKVMLLPSRTVGSFSLQILKPGFRMMLWSSGALVEYRICISNQPTDAIEFNFGRKKWGLHWLPCKIQMVVTGGRKAVCRRGVRVSYQSARITIIFCLPSFGSGCEFAKKSLTLQKN